MRWRTRGIVAVLGLVLGCSSEGDSNKDAGVGGSGGGLTSAAMTSVALYGAPCDAVKAGTVQTITIVFRCRIL